MIKANELRIGNWVAWDSGATHPDVIRQLKIDEFEVAEKDGIFQSAEPIPLSPEILEKSWFKSNLTDDGDEFYTLQLTDDLYNPLAIISTLIFDEDCSVSLFPNKSGKDFKYVHELQNLIFALTGTELSINL